MASRADVMAGQAFVRLYLKNDMSRQLVRALKGAQAKLRDFGRSAMTMGRQLAFAGTAMVAPFAFSTRTFVSFDDAMRKVQARSRGTAKELEAVRKQARKLGIETVFTADEIAELQAILSRRRFSRAEVFAQTPGILAFARAAGEGKDLFGDLQDAATLTTGALNAWGMEANESMHIADLMTTAVNNSALSMESLGESLAYVAPLAADMGFDLRETLQRLGELANIWIDGSRAGTSFRRMLINVAGKLEDLTKQSIAVETDDGGFRPIADIIKDIDTATKDLSKPDRMAVFTKIFGARAVTGAVGMARASKSAKVLEAALANVEGTANRTAELMDAGLGGELRRLRSVIADVRIAIGDALGPVIQQLAKDVIKAGKLTVEWIKANKGLVVVMAATAAGVLALGVAIFGIGAAATAASIAIGVLAVTVLAVLNPITLATVAFFKWTEAGQSAGRKLSATLGGLLGRFREVFGGINAAMNSGNFALAFDIMNTAAKLAFAEMAARATHVFRELIPGLAIAAFSGLAGAWGAVVGTWAGPVLAFWDLFRDVASAAMNFVNADFQSGLQMWKEIAVAYWKLYVSTAKSAFTFVLRAFGSMQRTAVAIDRALWKAFKALGLAAFQSVIASFIESFVIIPKHILKVLTTAFFEASKFLLTTLVGAMALYNTFAIKVAVGIGKAMKNALLGKSPGQSGDISDDEKSAVIAGQQLPGAMKEANDLMAGMADAAIAGLKGEHGDFKQVAADFGAAVNTAIQDGIGRDLGKLKNELGPALGAFASELSKAALGHADRIKAAGLDAAKTIAPAARRLAEATKGMSKEVKTAFLERFRAAFAEIKDFKDPKAVTALRKKLNSLIAEALEAKGAPADKPAVKTAGAAGSSGAGGLAAAGIPTGIGLTATYSAAAARIGGFQAGGGPEKQMADKITEVANNTAIMAFSFSDYLAHWKEGDTPSNQAARIQQDNLAALIEQRRATIETRDAITQFLAGWSIL